MKRNLLIFVLVFNTFLFLPEQGFSADKSVIVGFKQKPGPNEQALIHNAKGVIKKTYSLIPAMAVSLSEKEIEKLKKDKKVAYVEDDGIFTTADEYTEAWGVEHIAAEVAHVSGNKGAGIKIAVIDTGIDYTHEDLDGNYAGGYDFVFDDNDPFDDNSRSHGTHLAGIIAAEENDIGVIGVAPQASLYAVKVLDGAGFGLLSWIVSGLEWAVDNGMDIVNLSLQGPDSKALQDACNSTFQAGTLLVAAGGNTSGDNASYPAKYETVIAVTGTDAADDPAWFSPIDPELELAAPGLDIFSTIAVEKGSYGLLSGTSQAAPHVVGTAALFLAAGLSDENGNGRVNDEVRELLQTTAIDLGDAGVDNSTGYGLVNAAAAAFELTLIKLSSFSAKPGNGSCRLFWETESEIDNAGFNIYRSESEEGLYEQINDALIPAKGSPAEGASYTFLDDDVKNRKTYYYLLEDVDLNGIATDHGPVSAKPRLRYRVKYKHNRPRIPHDFP